MTDGGLVSGAVCVLLVSLEVLVLLVCVTSAVSLC